MINGDDTTKDRSLQPKGLRPGGAVPVRSTYGLDAIRAAPQLGQGAAELPGGGVVFSEGRPPGRQRLLEEVRRGRRISPVLGQQGELVETEGHRRMGRSSRPAGGPGSPPEPPRAPPVAENNPQIVEGARHRQVPEPVDIAEHGHGLTRCHPLRRPVGVPEPRVKGVGGERGRGFRSPRRGSGAPDATRS